MILTESSKHSTSLSSSSSSRQEEKSLKPKKSCNLCFKGFSKSLGGKCVMKKCSHEFHKTCLLSYAQTVESGLTFNCCPCCKKPYNGSKILNSDQNYVSSNTTCVICYESYSETNPPCNIPCNHFYHQPCLKQWVDKCNLTTPGSNSPSTCPYCRKQFSETDIKLRFDVLNKLQKENQSVSYSMSQISDESQQFIESSFDSKNDIQINLLKAFEQSSMNDMSIISFSMEEGETEVQDTSLNVSNASKSSILTFGRDQTKGDQKIPTIEQKNLNQNEIKEENTFCVFLKDLDGHSYTIQLSENETVETFVKKVNQKTEIDPKQMRFCVNNKGFSLLNNANDLLKKFNVRNLNTIHLLLRMKGGISKCFL